MSQTSKHVDWCLNKAKKELEECARLGKRPINCFVNLKGVLRN
ncbi:MAG: hypothetical protein US31_C0015G0015 [Berkelbacteria bacterium GW2011_GWA1_36_9]|uniref:Uncharacterized protein n=1 Tax=Berkelbacteria bacterium GW2011_GWA1_36_9 TaxID=1618331 RepID=A0A0G0I0R3_9BACT|nr:MAG: hypothetical protein US31_C0015G0015 [Berkelbacteria bacterium GW2011_GWA1_36_9]